MGKRSNFARYPLDKNDTPFKAVLPLLKHLPFDTKFIEPFAGNNVLVKHLEGQGHTCLFLQVISSQVQMVFQLWTFFPTVS